MYRVQPYWGWLQALRDAGLDYATINLELEEVVECRICGRSYGQLSVHLKTHRISTKEYRKDFNADTMSEAQHAERQARGRSTEANSGQLPLWDLPFSMEATLDRIAEYHRKGMSVHYDEMARREPSLINHAIRYVGSWDAALQAIDLTPADIRCHSLSGPVQYPTPGSVLEAIRRRFAARLPLNRMAITASRGSAFRRDIALFKRAICFFGKWDVAVRSAGLPVQRLVNEPRYLSRDSILEEIHRRHRLGLPLTAVQLTAGEQNRDKALYRNGKLFFGAWNSAVVQAGLAPQARRITGGRYPTAESVLLEIRRRMAAGLPVKSYQLKLLPGRDVALYKCAKRLFGSWPAALAAGVEERLV